MAVSMLLFHQRPAEYLVLKDSVRRTICGHLSFCIPTSKRINRISGMQVERLVSSGNPALSMEEIASAFKFPLDEFQKQAAEDFLAGHSVVVCAPTGAGKTAIAEAATIAVLARCAQSHALRSVIINHPHAHFSSRQRTVTSWVHK